MTSELEFDQVDAALRRCGANWSAAQAHGLLASQLAAAGAADLQSAIEQILEGCDPSNALYSECASLLAALRQSTHQQLSERLSAFELLLPDEATSATERAAALASWSEGYLHGLVSGPQMSGPHSAALRNRLSLEPLSDIIKDMLEITRAESADDAGDADEEAYTEIVEYLRVAAQLVYEELSDFRPGIKS